jgi:hypothetical protein
MLVQCHRWNFNIAEISCPKFFRSLRHGFGTLAVSLAYRAARSGLWTPIDLNLATAARYRLSADLIGQRVCNTNIPYNKKLGG